MGGTKIATVAAVADCTTTTGTIAAVAALCIVAALGIELPCYTSRELYRPDDMACQIGCDPAVS